MGTRHFTKEHKEKLRLAQPHRIIPPKKKLLLDLYLEQKKSTREIADILHRNQANIMRWLKLYEIPRRTYEENKMPVKRGGHHDWGKTIGKKMIGNKNSKNGKDHWNWQGGITPINAKERNSKRYKEWRTKVFKRDNYTCQNCGKRGGYLEADHIKPFSLYPKLRYKVSNGRTLCKKCHNLIGWQLFKDANPRTNL